MCGALDQAEAPLLNAANVISNQPILLKTNINLFTQKSARESSIKKKKTEEFGSRIGTFNRETSLKYVWQIFIIYEEGLREPVRCFCTDDVNGE